MIRLAGGAAVVAPVAVVVGTLELGWEEGMEEGWGDDRWGWGACGATGWRQDGAILGSLSDMFSM